MSSGLGSDPARRSVWLRWRDWVLRRRLVLGAVVAALLLGALGVWAGLSYREGVERRLSAEVNALVRRAASVEQDEEGAALLAEETLNEVRSGYLAVYDQHPSYKNALRALFLLANLEFKAGNFEAALRHYEVVAKKPRHYAAPLALYGKALAHFEREEFDLAIEALSDYESRYHDHYLKGEVYLLRGALFEATERYTEAKKAYESLLNFGLELYKTEALNSVRLLEARGFVLPSAPSASPRPGALPLGTNGVVPGPAPTNPPSN